MDLNTGPSSIPMAPMGMLQPLRAPLSLRFSLAILSITFAKVNQCVTNGHSLLLFVFSATVIALAFASTLTVFTSPGCSGETKEIDYICGCVASGTSKQSTILSTLRVSVRISTGAVAAAASFFSSTRAHVSAKMTTTRVSSSSVDRVLDC